MEVSGWKIGFRLMFVLLIPRMMIGHMFIHVEYTI